MDNVVSQAQKFKHILRDARGTWDDGHHTPSSHVGFQKLEVRVQVMIGQVARFHAFDH